MYVWTVLCLFFFFLKRSLLVSGRWLMIRTFKVAAAEPASRRAGGPDAVSVQCCCAGLFTAGAPRQVGTQKLSTNLGLGSRPNSRAPSGRA